MSISFEKNKKRHLIPNWRSFEKSQGLNELNSFGIQKDNNLLFNNSSNNVDNLITDWKNNKTIGFAADLISSAISLGINDNIEVLNASKFILNNIDIASNDLINSAKFLLKTEDRTDGEKEYSLSELHKSICNDKYIFEKISHYKHLTRKNPNNSINWVELARYYATIGQFLQAEKSMRIAISLNNENRFILRSASRFFVHLEDKSDIEFIHDVFRKNKNISRDSWLLGTEISLAQLRGRRSKFLDNGFKIVNDQKYDRFHITELAGTLATFEYFNGNRKDTKKLFKQALISPNDNSVAQMFWLGNYEHNQLLIENIDKFLTISSEADAWHLMSEGKWEDAYNNSINWLIDQPFSTRAAMFSSYLAFSQFENTREGQQICEIAHVANPHDVGVLNNLAFSFAINNDTENALLTLEKAKHYHDIENVGQKITLTATKGLIAFRNGDIIYGRKCYSEAFELSKKLTNKDIYALCLLNWTREEILNMTSQAELNIKIINQELKNDKISPDLITFRERVLRQFQEFLLKKTINLIG